VSPDGRLARDRSVHGARDPLPGPRGPVRAAAALALRIPASGRVAPLFAHRGAHHPIIVAHALQAVSCRRHAPRAAPPGLASSPGSSSCPECLLAGQPELLGRESDAQTNPVGALPVGALPTGGSPDCKTNLVRVLPDLPDSLSCLAENRT